MSWPRPVAVLVLAALGAGCTGEHEENQVSRTGIAVSESESAKTDSPRHLGLLAQPELDDPIKVGATYDFVVGTHCGVQFIWVDGDAWETPTPLIYNGSTPSGWHLGGQRGWLEIVSSTKAIFRDSSGHVVTFERQEDARPMCV